jgi:hypothetical protein
VALYISPVRRRRRTIVVGVVALAVGLLAGLVVGRTLGSSTDDDVAARQLETQQLIARLDGLDLEYQQTAGGGAGGSDALQGSVDAARSIAADTPGLLARMPWISSAEAQSVLASVAAVVSAVEGGVPPEGVSTAVAAADVALRSAAGLPVATG